MEYKDELEERKEMKKAKVKILIILLFIFIIAFISYLLSPKKTRSYYYSRIASDSLEPILSRGTRIKINTNFSDADLKVTTVVAFRKENDITTKIKKIFKIENGKYFVNTPKSTKNVEIISRQDILGIVNW